MRAHGLLVKARRGVTAASSVKPTVQAVARAGSEQCQRVTQWTLSCQLDE